MTADEKPDHESVDPRLLSIAKALSDGVPIDWNDEDNEDQELRGMKARLRFVESVAEAHRRMLREQTSAPEKKEGDQEP